MSINGLKPHFTDREGYLNWRKAWAEVYRDISQEIRRRKSETKAMQRNTDIEAASVAQKYLAFVRSDARKMMTILDEAKLRRDRILQMHRDLREQPFPLEIETNIVDVHFNRGHNEFAFLPRWVVKAKGQSYYVDHIDSNMPWSTRELDGGSTKGMLRFRKCRLSINSAGIAELNAA